MQIVTRHLHFSIAPSLQASSITIHWQINCLMFTANDKNDKIIQTRFSLDFQYLSYDLS